MHFENCYLMCVYFSLLSTFPLEHTKFKKQLDTVVDMVLLDFVALPVTAVRGHIWSTKQLLSDLYLACAPQLGAVIYNT